jgi:hypothetical protein
MCCLTYEHDSYLLARKRFPREGKTVRTAVGPEKVIGIDIWHDQVTLLDEARQRRVLTLEALRAEMASLQDADASAPAGAPAGPERVREKRRQRQNRVDDTKPKPTDA